MKTTRLILSGCLFFWLAAAPIVWTVRDGLGPDMVQTQGTAAATKFLITWGVPAIVLGVSLAMLGLGSAKQ